MLRIQSRSSGNRGKAHTKERVHNTGMKYATTLMLLLLLPVAHAIRIEEIYYNPHNEAGSEYVQLYNDDTQPLDLTGWTLATPASQTDATLAGTIHAGTTYLAADSGWQESKDNTSWPGADHEETLTLGNTGGYVQLIDTEGTVHDTVGYGDTERYEGTPHPGTEEGQALRRTGYSQDNNEDFEVSKPFSKHAEQPSGEQTLIEVSVENVPPELLEAKIQDDDPTAEGIQLLTETMQINLTVRDNNSLQNTLVFIDDQLVFAGSVRHEENISVEHNSSKENITISITDETYAKTSTYAVQRLSINRLELPESVALAIQPGINKTVELPVTNKGSAAVDLRIQGSMPDIAGRAMGTLHYTIHGEEYQASEDFRSHAVSLTPGETLTMEVRVEAGFVPTGTYTGQLIIAGVPE